MNAAVNPPAKPWADIERALQQQADREQDLCWYALVDWAQKPTLPAAYLERAGSLFGAAPDSPVGLQGPWLVPMDENPANSARWQALLRAIHLNPAAASVLATRLSPEELLRRLQTCLDLILPDESDDLQLAFWDPAILGSLVGQTGDDTLHVPGPILDTEQRNHFLESLVAWWYRNRDGEWQRIQGGLNAAANTVSLPFRFRQDQVDQLVEAGVPDLVLFHVRSNQPHLLAQRAPSAQYREIRRLVALARELGLTGLRDLVNLCCIGLIYGPRFDVDAEIAALLNAVKAGHMSLDEAMAEMPE